MAKRKTAARPGTRPAVPRTRREPAPLLAVDVGNSETVVGVLRKREVVSFWRLTSGRDTADEVALQLDALLRGSPLKSGEKLHAVLCSVAPALTPAWSEALARRTGEAPVEVSAATARSLPIRSREPSSVGADRIANAIAARRLYGTPAIVVDLGTATTFDCISRQGAYLGGVIAPGVMTSAEELFRRAARIPRVELRPRSAHWGAPPKRHFAPAWFGAPRVRSTRWCGVWPSR